MVSVKSKILAQGLWMLVFSLILIDFVWYRHRGSVRTEMSLLLSHFSWEVSYILTCSLSAISATFEFDHMSKQSPAGWHKVRRVILISEFRRCLLWCVLTPCVNCPVRWHSFDSGPVPKWCLSASSVVFHMDRLQTPESLWGLCAWPGSCEWSCGL